MHIVIRLKAFNDKELTVSVPKTFIGYYTGPDMWTINIQGAMNQVIITGISSAVKGQSWDINPNCETLIDTTTQKGKSKRLEK